MRTVLLVSAFVGLSLAAPTPQDLIDLSLVDSAENPTATSPPIGGGPGDNVYVEPLNSAVAVGSAAPTSVARRSISLKGLSKRDGDCTPQPPGTGPTVSPDTPSDFLNYRPFSDAANNAHIPEGYSPSFVNMNASSQTTSYLGYKTLDAYDPAACASYCNEIPGCQAINIYFERDPSVSPNSYSCPNPPSLTNIKCVRWGVQVLPNTTTNYGQWRDSFEVVIAGSNGYNRDAPAPAISGFVGPTPLGGALQATLDSVTSQDTYMGYKFFAFGTGPNQVQYFDPQVCTSACSAQTAYNSMHPPSTGNPKVCNQVISYVLNRNCIPLGIYCAMYTESWDATYGTNYGQYRGSDFYSVSQAYSYVNGTYASNYSPICATSKCPQGSFAGGNCGGWGAGTC